MSTGQHGVSVPVIDMWAPIVPSDEIIEDLQSGFPTEQLQYLEVWGACVSPAGQEFEIAYVDAESVARRLALIDA